MSREDLHFRLRIPEAVKQKVAASAAAHNRSMTAEIIAQLERAYDGRSEEEMGAREQAFQDALKMFRDAIQHKDNAQ